MSEAAEEKNSANSTDLIFDDFLLIKAFDMSVNLTPEELAKRLADSKNTVPTMKKLLNEHNISEAFKTVGANVEGEEDSDIANKKDLPKVGSYVRATYIDGNDYEAEILSVDEKLGKAHIKYIGYDNEENISFGDLLPSWGKRAREEQYEEAKADLTDTQLTETPSSVEIPKNKYKSKSKDVSQWPNIPPIPPIPTFKGMPRKDTEHLHAMLKAWYLSGYYTGIYEGVRINQQETTK